VCSLRVSDFADSTQRVVPTLGGWFEMRVISKATGVVSMSPSRTRSYHLLQTSAQCYDVPIKWYGTSYTVHELGTGIRVRAMIDLWEVESTRGRVHPCKPGVVCVSLTALLCQTRR